MFEVSNKSLIIRCTPTEKNMFSEMAAMRGMTLTELVKKLLNTENESLSLRQGYFYRGKYQTIKK